MLALIHGPTGCAAEWNALRAHLPPSLRLNCFAPELDYAAQTIDEIAADLRAQLAARKPQRLVLAAHGLANAVALRLADMADEVTLIAPPVHVNEALVPTHPETGEIWVDGLAYRSGQIAHFDFHRMVAMQHLSRMLSEQSDPSVLGRLREEGAAIWTHPALADAKVQIVAGTLDRAAPSERLHPAVSDDRLHLIPEAAHLVHLEMPQSLARLLGRTHGVVSPLTRAPAEVFITP